MLNSIAGTSSHLELTGNAEAATGYAGENVWPVIAAIYDQHGITATWIDGKLGVQVLGMMLWVQEFGIVSTPLDMVA